MQLGGMLAHGLKQLHDADQLGAELGRGLQTYGHCAFQGVPAKKREFACNTQISQRVCMSQRNARIRLSEAEQMAALITLAT
jgi:hypothetical protein